MSDAASNVSTPVPSPVPAVGSKKIVVCCDGTGNQFGDCNSNVVKIYTCLDLSDPTAQVAYYHPGVGTMGAPNARTWIEKEWSLIKGLAFAAGFSDNVLDAYRYLMSVYNDGDQVYLFGFSRGAYTVRALAGLLDGYGLLRPGNEGHLPYAWRLYLDQHKHRGRKHLDYNENSADAFKQTYSHSNFSLYFVGIWDTVSSVGWVNTPLRLFNVAQNRTIHRGRHAISIDERRCFYLDNLWGDELPNQSLQQVWFSGVHSDVGGSYTQATSGLSNITLAWMIDQARDANVLLNQHRIDLILGHPDHPDPPLDTLYQHPMSAPVHKSLKGPWWILELLPHLSYFKDSGNEIYRVPLGTHRMLPSGALVHHSVLDRIARTANATNPADRYDPPNLKVGTLTPDPASIPSGSSQPLLYTFNRADTPEPSFVARWFKIAIVSLLDLCFLRALYLLLKKGVGCFVWPWLCCIVRNYGPPVLHHLCTCYSRLSHFVANHLGPHVAHFFFP